MHGANDAQKTMGIIAGALVTGGYLQMQNGELPIPFWVVLLAHTAIGLGTLTGGWRIIHTMGSKITKLHPEGGFAAETGAAVAIYIGDRARRGHQHDAHHYRRHRRRGRDAALFRGAMGSRQADRVGVGTDDSGRRGVRRRHLLGGSASPERSVSRLRSSASSSETV